MISFFNEKLSRLSYFSTTIIIQEIYASYECVHIYIFIILLYREPN